MSEITFEALPLAAPLHAALRKSGYTTPSPIQAQAIPPLLEGCDLMGSAQTGTGKTAAFALPVLDRICSRPQPLKPWQARALVLVPTRELAVQVADSFAKYGAEVEFLLALVYGGVSQRPQERMMARGVDVLVATPGRLLDLVGQGFVDLSGVEFFILDEVDRMLDMGFIQDVRKIVREIPAQRQSLFFSATMAPELTRLAEGILRDPVRVTIAPEVKTAERVEQQLCFVEKAHKMQLLTWQLESRLEEGEQVPLTLVFARTKHGADKLVKQLSREGFRADAIHGNKSQSARQKALERFRTGRVPILVATDVVSRGIDVKDIALVVNYDLPMEPEAYVHRIGRTARAGTSGQAVAFCSAEEMKELRAIERLIKQAVPVDTEQPYHAAPIEAAYTRNNQPRQTTNRPAQGMPKPRGKSTYYGRRNRRRKAA